MLTQFGLVLIPLCLLCAANPQRLLQLVLLGGLFNAAAAVIIGGLGIQPSLVPASLFVAFAMLQMLLGVRYAAAPYVWQSAGRFVALTLFAVATAVVLPRLFAGSVEVWPEKVVASFTGTELLQPSFANVTQSLYLVIDCLILVTGALLTSRPGIRFDALLNTYLLGGWIVVGISFWQLASKVAGVPFPDSFFYSNPGWTIWSGQEFGGVPRINGPFAEPASLASYLAGLIFSCTWLLLRGHRSVSARALLPLALLTMALSTSTTGFVVLGIGLVLLLVYAIIGAPRALAARLVRFAVPAVVVLVMLGSSVAVLAPGVVASASEVVDATLSKGDSASYDDRTKTDADSMDLVLQTSGMGVGWGSNRSSSLLPGLLSTIGIPGVFLVVCFGTGLVRQVRRARRMSQDDGQVMLLDGFLISVLGQVIAALVSASTIETPEFFVQLGLLIGCSARVSCVAARQRRAQALVQGTPGEGLICGLQVTRTPYEPPGPRSEPCSSPACRTTDSGFLQRGRRPSHAIPAAPR